MAYQQLTIDQIKQLNEISNPVARRRLGILFQLPQDIQDVFMGEDSTSSVWNIAKEKYNLPRGKIGATARIIGLILLGELPIKNFIVALQKDLNIDLETAQAMAQDINMAIFQPIRESLMFVHNIGGRSGIHHDETPNSKTQIPNNMRTADSEQRIANRGQVPNYQTGPANKSQIPNPPVSSHETYRAGNQTTSVNNDQPSSFKNEYFEYEAQRKREDLINKMKIQQQQQPPPNRQQARPAMLRMRPNRNVVDLRVLAKKKYKKNHYDGFFSA